MFTRNIWLNILGGVSKLSWIVVSLLYLLHFYFAADYLIHSFVADFAYHVCWIVVALLLLLFIAIAADSFIVIFLLLFFLFCMSYYNDLCHVMTLYRFYAHAPSCRPFTIFRFWFLFRFLF